MPLLVDPFDKLADDLNATFRPQREWIDKQGLFLVTAHFFSGTGAGAWLFSWLFEISWGLTAGFLLVAAGGAAHLLFLGTPQRFWRMLARPQTSWISRGLISITFFLVFGFLYLLPAHADLAWTRADAAGRALAVLSLLGVAGILLYKGFVYAVSRAIPFWNTPLLPPLYIAYALRGGIAVLFVLSAYQGEAGALEAARVIEPWVVLSTAILVFFYLAVMVNAGVTPSESIRQLVRGRISLAFYLGAVLAGLIVPIVFGFVGYFSPLSNGLLALVGISSLVGDFYIKYCVSKAGIYIPLTQQLPVRASRWA
jgi:formate-dependent nitrite reductase membrane component NrfD